MAGDIGGTNSNFGVLDIQHEKEPKLIISLHVKSQTVVDYTDIAAQLHDYLKGRFGLKIYKACIGVAGVVSSDRTFAKPTNLNISLDGKRMQKALQLKDLLFINDFEAVAMVLNICRKSILSLSIKVALNECTQIKHLSELVQVLAKQQQYGADHLSIIFHLHQKVGMQIVLRKQHKNLH